MVQYIVTYRCERCGYKKNYSEKDVINSITTKDGWSKIDQKDVCRKCSKAYERTMNNFWSRGQACNTKGE